MTSIVSTRTLITIAVLTAGLIGLEHATSAVLNLLRGLATTKRFLVFFLTSVAITLFCKRFIRIEDTSDPSVAYLYLDEDEVLSESDDLFEDDSQEYATERDYPRAARSLAPRYALVEFIFETSLLKRNLQPVLDIAQLTHDGSCSGSSTCNHERSTP